MKYNKDFHTCLADKVDKYDGKSYCIDCRKVMEAPERTRHVFRSYDEAAHVWAQQKLATGKCYSMYFEGRSIYSYGSHFEIARFISPDVVLFTTRHYSNTTSSHKWAVRQALSHKTLFEVPDFDNHTKNAQYFIELIENQVKQIQKGRSALIQRVDGLAEYQETAKRYLDAFAGYVAAADRSKLRSLIRKVFFTKANLKAFMDKEARHEISQAQASVTRRRNDQIRWENRGRVLDEKRAMLDALLMNAESVWGNEVLAMTRDAWIAGDKRASLPYGEPILLRLVNDQDEIETSQGAFVPTTQAIDLYRAIKSGREIKGFEIGHYTVTGIHDGKLVVGCHRIPVREVLRMALTLGLESEAA